MFVPLDKNAILRRLSGSANKFDIQIFDTIESTNQRMRDTAKQKNMPPGTIYLAEGQTKAKGRNGKSWVAPYGRNLYLSFYGQLHTSVAQLAGLSLAIGIGLVQAIETLGSAQLQIKWPNDLYYDHKKWAGILIEQESLSPQKQGVVIGVGINVDFENHKDTVFQRPITDLNTVFNQGICRNVLAAKVILAIDTVLTQFERSGFKDFIGQWSKYDYLLGTSFSTRQGGEKWTGEGLGVNEQGGLLMAVDGKVKTVYSGSIIL